MTESSQTFTLTDCPPSLRHEFNDGYATTTAGVEAAGPDGWAEIDRWGKQAYERTTTDKAISLPTYWFLQGVRSAIAEHKAAAGKGAR